MAAYAAKKRSACMVLIATIAFMILMIVVVIRLFEAIPIEGTAFGLDWHGMWLSLQNGHIVYSNNHTSALMNPPWTVLTLAPLGFLTFRSSWGVISLLTLGICVISVPRVPRQNIRGERRQPYLIALILLTVSWPLLRQIADGNLEALIIGGACLIVASLRQNQRTQADPIGWLALGILLITAKVQESWLLLIALGLYLLLNWPIRRWGAAAGLTLLIVIPTMLWLGGTWLQTVLTMPQTDTIVFMNWQATLNRLAVPGTLALIGWIAILGVTAYMCWISRRSFDREKAGALIAASLLLAPYAAGNSILTVLAVGVIPFFQRRSLPGLLLILLCDAPILLSPALQYQYSADVATLTVLILWAVLCVDVFNRAQSPEESTG